MESVFFPCPIQDLALRPAETSTRRAGACGDTATVRVDLTGAQNDNSRVVVALYENKDGFTRDERRAASTARSPIETAAALRIDGVVAGDYAVLAFHDTDRSDTLNTNWVGMPKEGIALSKWKGGRATFDDSTFPVRTDTTKNLSFCYR